MLSKACIVGSYQRKLEELAKFDLELTVIVPPYWRDERGVIPLERAHTQGYELIVEEMALNGHFHLHFYPHLGRRFQRPHPDIVHIDEEPYNLATLQAMWLVKRTGAKALFFTWQNIHRRYPPPFGLIERYNLRNADYAIAGSTGASKVLRAKGYRGAIRVIPQFGVDPEIYQQRAASRRQQGFVIGYVGRLVEEKGVQVLIKATADLPGKWRLRILGDGPWRPHLEELARTLGIAQRASFEPSIPSIRMPEHYSQLDVLVLPSLTRRNWKEQFGRVLVEAMACEVPVVGSDSGEIPNVIGDAGFIFPEGDVCALKDILAQLMADPVLRAELGKRGRERVLAHYTQERVAADTYEVYQELANLT